MPWEAVASHPDCDGPAVIQSDTGELVACHDTMESAQRQVDALYASTGTEHRAQWTTAYINDLPDGAFLYIEAGGSKDEEGKTTPRSLRHFPYKDASGAVDLPHLRNALARIPQSNLSADVKARVTAKAQRILANQGESRSLPDIYFDQLATVPNFRSIPMVDVEMVDAGNAYRFDGLAAPTGVTADFDAFTEEYERGSFRRYLAGIGAKHNIPLCHEHDPKQLLGTTKSGRVKLDEDGRGLRTRANVVKTELSERIKALVDSGDVGGMSIGMIVGRGNSRVQLRGNKPHRAIQGFQRLLDVCTTFDPAYPTTEAQFRSAAIQLAASSPDLLQQVLLGAYPQLQDGATDVGAVGDDDADGDVVDHVDGDGSGATTVERRSIAARKRALQFLVLTTGGVDDDAS